MTTEKACTIPSSLRSKIARLKRPMKMVVKIGETQVMCMQEMLWSLEPREHHSQRLAEFQQARFRRKQLLDLRRSTTTAGSNAVGTHLPPQQASGGGTVKVNRSGTIVVNTMAANVDTENHYVT